MVSYPSNLHPQQLTLDLPVLQRPRGSQVSNLVRNFIPLAREIGKDVHNERLLVGLKLAEPYGIPVIEEACQVWPEGLVPFSEILSLRGDIDKRTLWVHFYEHDSRFTRLRRNPEKYREILRGFGGVISPDFSVRPNTPLVEAQHRVYENQLFGAYFQSWGIPTIANVRLQSKSSVPWALAGVPRESIVAIGTHGCARQKDANKILLEELAIMHDELNPTGLLVYGGQGKVVEDFCALNGIECRIFPADTGQRSSYRAVR